MKISELIGQLCEIEHKEGNIEVYVSRSTKKVGVLESPVKRLEIKPSDEMYDDRRVRLYF